MVLFNYILKDKKFIIFISAKGVIYTFSYLKIYNYNINITS